MSPIKSVGASVHSTTGSGEVRISSSNGSNAGQTTFRGKVELYWLPTPFACFPFTSPPVRHRVPSGSERALPLAGPSSRAVSGVGLRPLACCDRGFESHPAAWMFVCCECCVLSGRGLCDGLIIRSEESYRLWRVAVCDQVTSYARRLKPDRGL